MSPLRAEIERKLQLIETLRAEAKSLREVAKAEAAEFATRRKAAIKSAKALMRQHKLTTADLATA